jgi:tetratricopeptide (TPR) repeat protein
VDARSPAAVVATAALAALLLAAAVRVLAARERAYPAPADSPETLYLRSGLGVRRLSGPYTALAADVYWIRAIQYYGGKKQSLDARRAPQANGAESQPAVAAAPDTGYSLLFPLLDITTTLDPRFNIAYRFGAVFLAEGYPRGAGRPDQAIQLLQKGLKERPDKWEYMEDIGFVYYWFVHDFAAAGEWFQKAGDVPGAPWWLRSLAATTLAQGGDRQSSRAMWEAIRQSAEVEWQRKDAERRLAQFQALDGLDTLQRTVDDYRRRTGQTPDWPSLVRARVLRGIPLDPAGAPYELTADGRVRLSRQSPLWPPPDEPGGVPRSVR